MPLAQPTFSLPQPEVPICDLNAETIPGRDIQVVIPPKAVFSRPEGYCHFREFGVR
jgi:hypothetical protein